MPLSNTEAVTLEAVVRKFSSNVLCSQNTHGGCFCYLARVQSGFADFNQILGASFIKFDPLGNRKIELERAGIYLLRILSNAVLHL